MFQVRLLSSPSTQCRNLLLGSIFDVYWHYIIIKCIDNIGIILLYVYCVVHSQQNLAPLSPYLNFDPVYLPQSQPEFIFPEGAARQRGRFELAFSQIGVSCMTGAAVGGIGGLYNGLRNTTLAGHTGKLRRTQ